ncbi:MAG: 4-(cytidine 5'-diphospho)-2-C-methyl-D-erythritol kinase [Candidatus Eiseniibacteriota bacterium]
MLAVGPKRPEGFPDVATLLQSMALHDVIALAPRSRGFALRVRGPEAKGVPRGRANLARRAAEALARALGETRGASIVLTKKVPHGAGLGGGSSDAAATLLGLLALWKRRLPAARLHALAASLGSDVPFFLRGGTAIATGRGEILRSVRGPRNPMRLVVVVPEARVSTAWAYANHAIPKSRLTGFKRTVTLVQLRAVRLARTQAKQLFFNDLEEVVLRRVRAVAEARRRVLASGAESALMSGSGSAVFGLIPHACAPRIIAARLSRNFRKVYVARSVRAGSRPCRLSPAGR